MLTIYVRVFSQNKMFQIQIKYILYIGTSAKTPILKHANWCIFRDTRHTIRSGLISYKFALTFAVLTLLETILSSV